MDASRTGNITLLDLQETVMVTGKSSIETIDDFERVFKGYVRLLVASYHSLEGEKRKLGLKPDTLRTCFEMISSGNRAVSIQDFMRCFDRDRLQVNHRMINYLNKCIFMSGTLSEKDFVNLFSPIDCDLEPKKEEIEDRYWDNSRKHHERTREPLTEHYQYPKEKIQTKISNTRDIDSRID